MASVASWLRQAQPPKPLSDTEPAEVAEVQPRFIPSDIAYNF